jgi:hypothetical protein
MPFTTKANNTGHFSVGSSLKNLSTLAYFGLVTHKYFSNFYQGQAGILRLGLKSLSDGTPTVVDMLKQAGVIKYRVFGLYLNTGRYKESGYGFLASNLQIGGYDFADVFNFYDF